MEYLAHYGLFAAEIATVVVAVLLTVAGVVAIATRGQAEGGMVVTKINDHYEKLRDALNKVILNKKSYKKWSKDKKRQQEKLSKESRKRYFFIDFNGDIRAQAVKSLREEVTAILSLATPKDEVVISIESPGGTVNGYGFAASQLERLRAANIPLTACVDKVAASGGYLMACVANRIIAAPFAIIGSIGVVAQLPNFHRYLKERKIDFELLTAGEYKRTITMFGENTEKGREKFVEDLETIHLDFKNFVSGHRPDMDIAKVATGEHWLGTQAHELGLVDVLQTSDDYLLTASQNADIYRVTYKTKQSKMAKITQAVEMTLQQWFFR